MPSDLEEEFVNIWNQLSGPTLEREVVFCPTRKWRIDFYEPLSQTVIEIEGLRGRHQYVGGFIADTRKYNEISFQKKFIFRLTKPDITEPWIKRIINFTKGEPYEPCERKSAVQRTHARSTGDQQTPLDRKRKGGKRSGRRS